MARLNPDLPAEAPEEAYRKRMCTDAPSLMQHIHSLHRMLADGGTMKYRRKGDSIAGAQTKAIDFYGPDNNDWPVVIFPGNVGDAQALRTVYRRMVGQA